jgi:hypothetical protein
LPSCHLAILPSCHLAILPSCHVAILLADGEEIGPAASAVLPQH